MTPIKIECDCGLTFTAPQRKAGKIVHCQCGRPYRVPATASSRKPGRDRRSFRGLQRTWRWIVTAAYAIAIVLVFLIVVLASHPVVSVLLGLFSTAAAIWGLRRSPWPIVNHRIAGIVVSLGVAALAAGAFIVILSFWAIVVGWSNRDVVAAGRPEFSPDMALPPHLPANADELQSVVPGETSIVQIMLPSLQSFDGRGRIDSVSIDVDGVSQGGVKFPPQHDWGSSMNPAPEEEYQPSPIDWTIDAGSIPNLEQRLNTLLHAHVVAQVTYPKASGRLTYTDQSHTFDISVPLLVVARADRELLDRRRAVLDQQRLFDEAPRVRQSVGTVRFLIALLYLAAASILAATWREWPDAYAKHRASFAQRR